MKISKQLLLLIRFSIVFSNIAQSQNNSKQIDSLNVELKFTKYDTTKLKILDKLLELCDEKDNLLYAEPVVKIAENNLKKLSSSAKYYLFYSKHLANAYNGIGYYYDNKDDTAKAIRNYEQSLKIYDGINNEKEITFPLNNLANLYIRNGNSYKAETLLLKSVDIKKRIVGENHPAYASVLYGLGIVYYKEAKYIDAKKCFLQTLEIRKNTLGEEHPDYVRSLSALALLYATTNDYKKAEPIYIKVLSIKKKTLGISNPLYGESLGALGYFYSNTGNYLEAEPLLIQSLEVYKKTIGELATEYANVLCYLANLYRAMGNYNKSEPLFLKVLLIQKKTVGETHRDYAHTLNDLGLLYLNNGNYFNAEKMLIMSSEIFKKRSGEFHPEYANSLNNLSQLYSDLGNYSKAELLILKAIEIEKKTIGDTNVQYGTSLNNLALIYMYEGNYIKAEPIFLHANEIYKKSVGEYNTAYATSLNNLGELYDKIGNYVKEEQLLLQSTEIQRRTLGEFHADYANSLNNLGLFYIRKANYEKAEKLLIQASEINKKCLGEFHPLYANSLVSLVRLYYSMAEYDKILPLYLNSLEINLKNIESQFSFLSEKEKEFYLKIILNRFEYFNDIALKKKEKEPDITIAVYNYQLKLKGILLKSSTAMRNAVLSSNDEKLIATFDSWNSKKKQIVALYNLPIEKRKDDLPKLENEANDLEKELTRSSCVLSDFNSSMNINWKDIQTALKPNEAAIEFTNFKYTKDSVLYCALIIKKDSKFPEMVQLFEEKQLQSLLEKVKNNFNMVYGTREFTRTQLYDIIWKPLEPYLKGINTINYSPSGLLHQVSFAALSNGADHYLIDDYKLNQVSSTAQLIKPVQSNFDKNTTVSLFGGITYSIKDKTNDPFPYLSGTLSETEGLNDTLTREGIKVNFVKAKDATKQEFKSLATNSNIIHIATHGFFFPEPKIIKTEADENETKTDIVSRTASRSVELNYYRNNNPLMRSGLLFAGANDYWNGITDDVDSNGVLTALEVVNIDLRKNKLVVLSACETGLGDIKDGEGVYGLQRAFKMAGTENIIMSLWDVSDKETSEFMQMFYHFLFEEQNIIKAFAETQNIMRKKYDPEYWAAFVLVR